MERDKELELKIIERLNNSLTYLYESYIPNHYESNDMKQEIKEFEYLIELLKSEQ